MLAAPYFCTFGGELAINSILSSYYLQHAPKWGQTKAGQWAAMYVHPRFRHLASHLAPFARCKKEMEAHTDQSFDPNRFGLLNVVTRPAGGYISDKIYQHIGPKRGVNFKKFWYGFLCFMRTSSLLPRTQLPALIAPRFFEQRASSASGSASSTRNP